MGKWRDLHSATTGWWRNLEDAAICAVNMPNDRVEVGDGKISFDIVDEWLTMILPNQKRLWYFDPQLRSAMPPWHRPETEERCAIGTCDCEPRTQVTYMAQKEGQWRRVHSYGGKWAENACQGVSREILEAAKLRLEKAGYPIIFSVYDEPICEVDDGFGSPEEMAEIMSVPPEWATDWPIRVTAWEGARYRK